LQAKKLLQRVTEAYLDATIKVSLADMAALSRDIGKNIAENVAGIADGLTERLIIPDGGRAESQAVPRGANSLTIGQSLDEDEIELNMVNVRKVREEGVTLLQKTLCPTSGIS